MDSTRVGLSQGKPEAASGASVALLMFRNAAPAPASTPPGTPPPWTREVAGVLADLGSNLLGLPADEAQRRLTANGPNLVDGPQRTAALRLLAHQFASPLVLILVLAAAVSLFLHNWSDAAIILAIVLGSTLLGFTQEYRATNAVAALRERLALTSRVRRDGRVQALPAQQLVRGDLVELAAGNLVPADGVLIEARDLMLSEASLTGESFPVEKHVGPCAANAAPNARDNSVFLGTSVRSGSGVMLITATGHDTEVGGIATHLGATEPPSEFERGIAAFGVLLLRVMVVMVLLVMTINTAQGRAPLESLLFAVALAVGLSPELLPAIVSVTLSHGARAMATHGVLIRRLEAIENLGSIDILCCDKTGTLTEGRMTLSGALDAQGRESRAVLALAWLNASLETGIDNPLDRAIVEAGKAAQVDSEAAIKIDEIPYDFERKRLTIVVQRAGDAATHELISKGAFDNVLATCADWRVDGVAQPLDETARAGLRERFRAAGAAGLRVLGVATQRHAAQPRYGRADEAAMCFEGFLTFTDPPKAGVEASLQQLRHLGIHLKIITGDNRHVAQHLAHAVGLDAHHMLTGPEITAMRDEALWQRAPRITLFAEIDPQQKERIVRALQHGGHAVGFLGDGINDAPALRAADVGISVQGATDVARESADVVLLRSDLDLLRQGVELGRRAFTNTLKYISITTSANFGNMISMALAAPLLPFLPLAPKQILLNNFLSDLPSMAIATDNVDPEHLHKPQRWNIAEVRRFMLVFGLISSLFDLLAFGVLLGFFAAGAALFQTAWFVVSLLTELAVVLVLRTRRAAWRSQPARLLAWATLAVITVALLLPYSGSVAALFGFVPLPWPLLAVTLAIAAAYIGLTEAAKHWFYAVALKPRAASRARRRRR